MATTGRFDKGVGYYTSGELHLNVFFPEDEVACQWCPFLQYDRGLDRYSCSLTNRILYSRFCIPEECPIVFPVKEVDPPAVEAPVVEPPLVEEKPVHTRRSRKKSVSDEPVA